jgi:ABC-2 type transport system permease protein
VRRLGTTPASPMAVLGAQLLRHAAAIAASSLVVVLGSRLAFDVPLPASLLGYLVAYIVALAASLALGGAITAISPSSKVGPVIGMIAFFPSMFCAGVYVPIEVLRGPVHTIAGFTPYGVASNALNRAVLDTFLALADLAVNGSWAVMLLAVAVRFFHWE